MVSNASPQVTIKTRGGYRHTNTRTLDFKSFGEFCQKVYKAKVINDFDVRLSTKAPTTYSNEGVGTEGGFAVPHAFRDDIFTRAAQIDLLHLCDTNTISTNTIAMPTDPHPPWSTSGPQATWRGEATQHTQSKPALNLTSHRLGSIAVFIPVTDELLEDAPGLDRYMQHEAGNRVSFAIALAIIQGSVGGPLGIINAGGTITVTKDGGQTADTITAPNLSNMWKRLYAPSRDSAVWLCHPDAEGYLIQESLAGNLPASIAEHRRIMDRPIIPHDGCNQLGDLGDIVLADLSQYVVNMRSNNDLSPHLWFDRDISAFRLVTRVQGCPWFGSTITARSGSQTYSPFVTLAERA